SFPAVSVHAAEGGSDANAHANELFKWINFALVAIALIWVFGKLLPPVFRKRSDEIGAAIKKATEARLEADRQLCEAEQKMAKLEKEIAQLRAVAQREGAAGAERLAKAPLTTRKRSKPWPLRKSKQRNARRAWN